MTQTWTTKTAQQQSLMISTDVIYEIHQLYLERDCSKIGGAEWIQSKWNRRENDEIEDPKLNHSIGLHNYDQNDNHDFFDQYWNHNYSIWLVIVLREKILLLHQNKTGSYLKLLLKIKSKEHRLGSAREQIMA